VFLTDPAIELAGVAERFERDRQGRFQLQPGRGVQETAQVAVVHGENEIHIHRRPLDPVQVDGEPPDDDVIDSFFLERSE